MRLAVFGATGRIGGAIVRQALAAGDDVVAFVRTPAQFAESPPELKVVAVTSLAESAPLASALAGCDAVISAVGPRSRNAGPVTSTATRAILAAMNAASLKRLIVVSAAPVGPTPENEAPLIRWLLLPIVSRLLREHYDDLAEMESEVKSSATEWTIVRPPRLTSGPASGRYRIRVGGTIARGYSISRANVAHAMLAAVTDPGMVRKVIGVAN